MSKIIVHNQIPELSDYAALCYIQAVMQKGKVSGLGDKAQYCYLTVYNVRRDKDQLYEDRVVTCKKRGDTYTFKLYTEKPHP